MIGGWDGIKLLVGEIIKRLSCILGRVEIGGGNGKGEGEGDGVEGCDGDDGVGYVCGVGGGLRVVRGVKR